MKENDAWADREPAWQGGTSLFLCRTVFIEMKFSTDQEPVLYCGCEDALLPVPMGDSPSDLEDRGQMENPGDSD